MNIKTGEVLKVIGLYIMHGSLVRKIQVAVEVDTCSLQNCVA
jgi:hypothetical protein